MGGADAYATRHALRHIINQNQIIFSYNIICNTDENKRSVKI